MVDPSAALMAIESPTGLAATAAASVGVVVATRRSQQASKVVEVAQPIVEEDKEMSISELLKEYGVIALMFHFTVWCTTIALALTTLSLVGPENLASIPMLPVDMISGEQPVGGLGKAAVVLALVEVTGPPRLALTVAVTPVVSKKARSFAVVRDAEASLLGLFAKLTDTVKKLSPEKEVPK